MSIEDLSLKSNLSIPYLSSLIKGTRKNPSLDTIYKLLLHSDLKLWI